MPQIHERSSVNRSSFVNFRKLTGKLQGKPEKFPGRGEGRVVIIVDSTIFGVN